MKVLWIADNSFPVVLEILGKKSTVNASWVNAAAQHLISTCTEIELYTAEILDVPKMKMIQNEGIKHFVLPLVAKKRIDYWKVLLDICRPEIIHVHGTEYPFLFDFFQARSDEKVILSIQGLVSVIERYYFGSISIIDLVRNITLRDIIRFDTIFHQQKRMRQRGKIEIEAIQRVGSVIGRTEWDKAHAISISQQVNYWHNNETLRTPFYHGNWTWETCQKHRIFISQGHYPLKGLHMLLKALPSVINKYPNTEVYIAGHDFFSNRGIKINGYGRYINRLIKRLGLGQIIHFTGFLNAEEMKVEYLKANVFICPSAVENSPNSVGEAQILGIPVIASYVGGISTMVEHHVTGLLYRFEEPELLAHHILDLFANEDLCKNLSAGSRLAAIERHNPIKNAIDLQRIYQSLLAR